MTLVAKAPAKVNLSLVVRGRLPNGYHALESLGAFAAVGDELSFTPGVQGYRLSVRGATAKEAGATADNLVLKAANLLAERVPGLAGGEFRLVKRLPVAAGLGGGSSDAAAALRLLAQHHGLSSDDLRLLEVASVTGADVPVCLAARARVMTGTGTSLGPVLAVPRVPAILINPRVSVPTPDVFKGLGLAPGENLSGPDHLIKRDWGSLPRSSVAARRAFVEDLAQSRNDLEPPAQAIAPVISTALHALKASTGCLLSRMSGSGATVFGLYDTCKAAASAAKIIRADHPDWWIKPTMLG
ncbi:MAG: 4-(cytidine 5'-diphospho)-2-C-methyl-D-erythritol kinase [Alphaproteobacteria bacterium]